MSIHIMLYMKEGGINAEPIGDPPDLKGLESACLLACELVNKDTPMKLLNDTGILPDNLPHVCYNSCCFTDVIHSQACIWYALIWDHSPRLLVHHTACLQGLSCISLQDECGHVHALRHCVERSSGGGIEAGCACTSHALLSEISTNSSSAHDTE